MNRKGFTQVFLMLIGLLTGIILCEVFVRITALAPAYTKIYINGNRAFESFLDPILRYVPQSGAGTFNSYGIRNEEFKLQKEPRTIRIILLGDSIAFGACASDLPLEQRFSDILQKSLNEAVQSSGTRIEILNFGVPGYDTADEVAFFAIKGRILQPDIVVVFYCLNDTQQASSEVRALSKDSRFRLFESLRAVPFAQHLIDSHLFRLIVQRYSSLHQQPIPQEGTNSTVRVSEGFQRLKNYMHSDGFKVLVAINPFLIDFNNYTEWQSHEFGTLLAQQAGFRTYDLLQDYRKSGQPYESLRCTAKDTIHPNAEGHALIAQALKEPLLKLVLPLLTSGERSKDY